METVILGAGGHSKVILDLIRENTKICFSDVNAGCMKDWRREVTLLDDGMAGANVMDFTVKGSVGDCVLYQERAGFVIAIGNNKTREHIAENYALNYITLIHPSAVIGSGVEIGEGTVVMAGAVINSGSKIGRHCIINTGATVDHDCALADFVHISPGAHLGGTVVVGKRSWIGIGGCVGNNLAIEADCVIGAGGVVIKNIDAPGVYAGIPARKIR